MFAVVAFFSHRTHSILVRKLKIVLQDVHALYFVDYFEELYLGRINQNGSRRVYRRTIQHLTRTHNAIEGFHTGFDSRLQTIQTDVWKF